MKYTHKLINSVFPKKKNKPIVFDGTSSLIVGKNVNLEGTRAILTNNSTLRIEDNVTLTDFIIIAKNAYIYIGHDSILEQGNQPLKPKISINNGSLTIGHHNKIKSIFLIRFGGNCVIGNYNSINELTEIRCDEKIVIGDFNLISYECMIYDTNTHCIYPAHKRRQMTINDYPSIGAEYEKPNTKPVVIGNDCWIGKRGVVLKGGKMNNSSILGTNSVLTSELPNKSLGVGNPATIRNKT